ncbi:LppP/LprE family lipoprotein, partial [Mycobacterium ulcerans]
MHGVKSLPCPVAPLTGALALVAATLTGCGSGDSIVAKTPEVRTTTSAVNSNEPNAADPPPAAAFGSLELTAEVVVLTSGVLA